MVVAIVTARKNSKGLPGKNTMMLGNMSLIEHSIMAANNANEIDEIILSTDIEEIIEELKNKYSKLNVPYIRPEHLCQDDSTHVDVMNDLIQYFEKNNKRISHFVLLQPTSPFRTYQEINEGVKLLKSGIESVLGVCKTMHHPADYIYLDYNKKIKNVMPDFKGKRRQEFPEIYFNNGAFYGCSVNFFKKNQMFYDENSQLLIMNENTLIDIDTELDMKFAKSIIE